MDAQTDYHNAIRLESNGLNQRQNLFLTTGRPFITLNSMVVTLWDKLTKGVAILLTCIEVIPPQTW